MTKIQEDFEVRQTANFELSIFMKMIICSLIGIVSFFITFEWNGKSKRS